MMILKGTIYRTLELNFEINLSDKEEEDVVQTLANMAASTVSADFTIINEEYAELEDGRRINII